MSVANNALLYNLGLLGTPVDDNQVAAAGITCASTPNARQVGAVIRSELTRFTRATDPTNNAALLKSISTGEAAALTFVINDAPNPIQVFCASGEKLNGSTNGSLSIPAGQSGIFVRVPNNLGGADWRASAIP